MMKSTILVVLALSLSLVDTGSATTLPGSIGDEYAAPLNLERITVGANYESIRRLISPDSGGEAELNVNSYSLFLGVDVLRWVTLFGTWGQAESDDDMGVETDWERKWSVGINANICAWNMRGPIAVVGDRVAVRGYLEYSNYEIDGVLGDVDWDELAIALPIAFEMFEDNSRVDADELFRLSVYAGPLVSLVDGSAAAPVGDFSESTAGGLIAGCDLYFTAYLSLGGQVHLFDTSADEVDIRGSLRYHF